MSTLLGHLGGRGWLEEQKEQKDPSQESQAASSLQEAKGSLLDMIYSRFLGLSTISHASSLPISPSPSSADDTPLLTSEDIYTTSHPTSHAISPSHSSLADGTPPLTWKDLDKTYPARRQLEAIIADGGSKPWKRVSELHLNQSQAVLNELQQILDYSPQMESTTRTSAIKCLQAIGTLFNCLPASMMIQDVIKEKDNISYRGGFADVWLGRVGSQKVALKVLRIYSNDSKEAHMKTLKAFHREALLWRQLQHPRILPLYGVNTVTFPSDPCLVSPYMYNGNINQFLLQNSTHDRFRMMIEIMDGIQFLHAHDRPIVHGDIRGSNILVKEDLTCCISDFGLTMVVDPRITSSRLTGGAIRWLAPEVLAEAEGQVTPVEDLPSRDIYAFGCTTIEVCSGNDRPFPNIGRDFGVYFKVLAGEIKPSPPPTTFLPQRVWDIVARCFMHEARYRPSAREALEILREIRWKEDTWYDFRTMLKDTEKLLEGTPFSTTIAILTAVIDTIHDVLDNLKQEFITAHLSPFTHHLKNLLEVMKDEKYLNAGIDPAREHINSILRDANAALERTQRSINTVEANEYQRQVEDIIRRVDEAATGFELELASASDRQIHPGKPRSSLSHLHKLKAPAVFALTIGIDEHRYESFRSYSGCVADADDMVNVLVKTLHVPLTHITNLRNENATAARITAAFESLAVDKRITKNANIIIFYAGHCIGLETGACDTFETLVPYDFDPGSDPDPVTRNALADVKISQLLEQIANAKGNNITVILDTSYPSIGTLGMWCTDSGMNGDGFDLAEENSLGSIASSVARRTMLFQNKASYVLLTGCTKHQQSYEKHGRGAFTSALVNQLKSEDLQQLTYSDLICRLPALTSQDPQCEGKYQHRIFLGGAAPLRIRILYRVTQSDTENAGKYVVNAGEAHGVTVNAEFTVYDTKACTKEIGRLVVRQSAPFQSFLRPVNDLEPFILPETIGYALLTDIRSTQDVRLLVDLDSDLVGVLASLGEQMRAEYPGKPSFQVATRDEHPHLVVTANEGRLRFEITDKMCRHAGLLEIPHTSLTDRETMTRVFRGVADFYWNLHRTPSDNHINIMLGRDIQLECYKLEQEDPADKFNGVMKCTGANLFVDRVIQVHANDEEKVYGFRIENMTDVPLFVSMFYFNMSDLSIDSYYEPPSACDNGHLAPLPPRGILTIGHSSDAYGPRTLFLEDGQDVDVGYLKLFISTDYVDLSMTPQSSPFLPEPFISTEYVDHDRILQSSPFPPRDRHFRDREMMSLKVWDTMLVPIVLHREGRALLSVAGQRH